MFIFSNLFPKNLKFTIFHQLLQSRNNSKSKLIFFPQLMKQSTSPTMVFLPTMDRTVVLHLELLSMKKCTMISFRKPLRKHLLGKWVTHLLREWTKVLRY